MSRDPSWFAPTEDAEADRRHGDLLSLDPSVRSPGASLMRNGAIIACARIKIPAECHDLPRGERYQRVAHYIVDWWMDIDNSSSVRTFVYEHPQWYNSNQGKTKGDPNLLAGLVGTGAAVAAMLTVHAIVNGHRPPEIVAPLPSEWTKLPKVSKGSYWRSPRGARLRDRLTPGELALVPDQHDAGDGAALALWAAGRMKPRHVFPGAT